MTKHWTDEAMERLAAEDERERTEAKMVRIEGCDIASLRLALRLVNEARDKRTSEFGHEIHAAAINLDRIIEDWNEAL